MEAARRYQGSPQQARAEAERLASEMGLAPAAFEQMKRQAQAIAQAMGMK